MLRKICQTCEGADYVIPFTWEIWIWQFPLGGQEFTGYEYEWTFWGNGNFMYLIKDVDCTGVCICQNSLKCAGLCILEYINLPQWNEWFIKTNLILYSVSKIARLFLYKPE